MLKSGVFFEEINDDGTIEKGLKILEFITEY